MGPLKWSGVVWLFAAVFSVVITVVFRDVEWQWILTIIAGLAAAIVGLLLVWRPTRSTLMWSLIVGGTWLAIYAWLTYWQRAEQIAWTTDVFIGALAVIAAALSLTRLARPA